MRICDARLSTEPDGGACAVPNVLAFPVMVIFYRSISFRAAAAGFEGKKGSLRIEHQHYFHGSSDRAR